MRTLIDIPEEDIAAIKQVTVALGISRAEFVRRAVSQSLEPYRTSGHSEAFGICAGKLEDGLQFQDRLRGEW
ncbi:ribbon-helix-helix protein, CopG family [Granulicella tundricola]|uniref:Putative transcriptional regulator, CopG family n=1 Tax=Granulicella tundricola (strain ATCC BAA-1859 / DSM 23138 / MP5ACTX9) TaxID=1198114 RepID=E8X6H5_GRATM|nr:ribbon-helix-helix protein, CopG family [Granulicella tundricola]ADW71059.1 putative transcriptional regulator, CopG family [Granulicella tundricola MP5ACTX9]